jgi:hypothetical protein
MTERWELDTTSLRGTFGHSLQTYVRVARTMVNQPNERPKSGNLDPDYIAPAGVDYNNIEAKFQLSFKTKVLQGVFGVMVIYGWPILKSPIGKSIIIFSRPLELIMNPNLF